MSRRLTQGLVRWFIAILAVLTAAATVFPATRTLVFSKGDTWTYEGTVAWQEGTKIKRRHVRLVTSVIDAISYPAAQVAVVRSFPSELAWYGDKPRPQYSLLVLSAKALAELNAGSEQEALLLAKDLPRIQRELSSSSGTLMDFPLTDGRTFRASVAGAHPSRKLKVYQTIYRTNPDHTIIDFVPELGVVRYVYEHHGTTSSVDVRLVKVTRRAKR